MRFILLAALVLLSEIATAQMDPMFMGMWRAEALGRGSQNVLQTYYDDGLPAAGTSGLDEFGLRVSSALFHEDKDTYSIRAAFDDLQVRDTWTIPAWGYGTAFDVPHSLDSIMLGSGWERELHNGDTIGVSLGFGSDSDRPFATWDETTLQVTGLYRMPISAHSTWIFFLNYSNNRTFLNGIPIPGALYSYVNPEKRLAALAGFPLAFVSWGYAENLDLRASFFVPRSILLENGFRFSPPSWRAFVRFEIQERPFLQVNREAPSEQLFFERTRAGLGLQFPVMDSLMGEITAGYEFDQQFYESYERNNSASAMLPNDGYARAQLTYRF